MINGYSATPGDEVEAAIRARADREAATGQPRRGLESYGNLLAKVLPTKPDPEADLRPDLPHRMNLWRLWDRKLPHNPYVLRQRAALPVSPR